jgi:pilus assembly protein CpaB
VNPRQRRGALFLAVAVLGAVVVFFSIVGFVNNVESQIGDRVTAWVVDRDVTAYSAVTPDDVRQIEMPRRWLPDTAVRSLQDLAGTVATTALPAGTLLQRSNLVPAPSLRPGQREIAVMVDAETGVAGKIKPGDYVDVWATFSGLGPVETPHTKLIAQRLLIIDVGHAGERQQSVADGQRRENKAVPITFALGETDIKALTFAETFAEEVRLALRPPADETLVPRSRRSYAETLEAGGPR